MNKNKVFFVPVLADIWRLFLNFSISLYLYSYQKAPYEAQNKINKYVLSPPSANNFEHPMPCWGQFLEDLVPPSKLVCHTPFS